MSLVNQALRKAQRDRAPQQQAAEPGAPTPAAYAASAPRGLSPALVIGLIVSVAVLVGLVVGLSVIVFRDMAAKPDSTTAVVQTQPVEATAAKPASTTETLRPGITPSAAPTPSIDTNETVQALREAREATEAKLFADKVAAEVKAITEKQAAQAPSQTVVAWIAEAKVAGVKISNAGNKALINGKAYRAGEIVDYQLGLRILVIEETRILFVDQDDKKYMKRI